MNYEAFLGGRVMLYAGDCLDVLDALAENSVDSIVCDPPYHLTSIVKRFGAKDAAEAKDGATGAFKRASAGFMGKQWDGGDIAFQPETWARVLRVLKPGGYILAFSSSRTFGRMSVAIEDAGFITHPMIGWIFGSGFPKAHRVHAEGYEGFRYGGQATKPALEPIYMGQKPFSEKNGTANVLRWGTGALNIDGCRVGDTVETWPKSRSYAAGQIQPGGIGETQATGDVPPGRWPANIIHDGSAEVIAAFPEADGAVSNGKKAGTGFGNGYGVKPQAPSFADSGSAARFFYAVEKEERCDLCRVLLSGKDAKDSPCDANTAELTSPTQSTPNGATVRDGAAVSPPLGSAGKKQPSNGHAIIAESRSFQCHQTRGSFAPSDALTQEASRIAPHVRSAASLCASCETDIAQSLAATRLGLDPASLPCLESMPARRRQILLQHLALYVAGRESTDTITTTASLKTLFGSVLHAIADTTSLVRPEGPESTESARRLFYSSKADADDRLGSKHPTVKPLDLMQYLVRLVTPPGGLVLDPFAGTGTTGEAAWREGMRATLIEREPEYQGDIRRRMELVEKPTKRAAVAKSKNSLQGAEGTPLFAGDAA